MQLFPEPKSRPHCGSGGSRTRVQCRQWDNALPSRGLRFPALWSSTPLARRRCIRNLCCRVPFPFYGALSSELLTLEMGGETGFDTCTVALKDTDLLSPPPPRGAYRYRTDRGLIANQACTPVHTPSLQAPSQLGFPAGDRSPISPSDAAARRKLGSLSGWNDIRVGPHGQEPMILVRP